MDWFLTFSSQVMCVLPWNHVNSKVPQEHWGGCCCWSIQKYNSPLFCINLHKLLFVIYVAHTHSPNINRTRNFFFACTTIRPQRLEYSSILLRFSIFASGITLPYSASNRDITTSYTYTALIYLLPPPNGPSGIGAEGLALIPNTQLSLHSCPTASDLFIYPAYTHTVYMTMYVWARQPLLSVAEWRLY